MKEDKNICSNCVIQLDKLQDRRDLPGMELDIFKRPRRTIILNIPLRKDSGEVIFLNGYRVQYNNALGPVKGGIRFHPELDLEEMKTLSFLMSLKTALVGLPFGGAKGGIEVDPKTLSKNELERLSRSFVREMSPFIGPNIDVPAPDVNTDSQVMAWMVDEYSTIKGMFTPGAFTGKPIELGGSKGRTIATALGGAYILQRMVEIEKLKPENMTVVIQGFGNVGANIAKLLFDWGYKVVAVSDSKGGIYDPSGLDIDKIISKQKDKRSLPNLKDMKQISNKELLGLECDVLIPAAISYQITTNNAEDIKAKIILEMANAPVSPEASDVLLKRKIKIIPDILANAGGVIVSYFEWVQNSGNEYWTEKVVLDKLKEKIIAAFDEVVKICDKDKYYMRDAAYIIALNRIIKAEKSRGNI